MSRPSFSVPVADLEDGPKVVDFEVPTDWLAGAFEGTEALPREGNGVVHVELTKNGRDVLVRGYATANITMPCVVTLDPLPFELRAEISLLLTSSEVPGKAPRGGITPIRAAKGPKKPRGTKAWAEEPELPQSEVARDTFSGDKIVLDDFLREFILLELPMYPRRSDLPSTEDAATSPAPEPEGEGSIDPRLRPLLEIAERMKSKDKKE